MPGRARRGSAAHHTLRGALAFSTWLREVTANSARSTYRSLKRRSTTVLPAEAVDRPILAPPASSPDRD
jgi:DNA-directed RNA polymerase specialized sigma24 family protein